MTFGGIFGKNYKDVILTFWSQHYLNIVRDFKLVLSGITI